MCAHRFEYDEMPYFNSIKVRLEPVYRPTLEPPLCQFQFHKGTIRTCCSVERILHHLGFQFHKGTIRTLGQAFLPNVEKHFNSIKVRLEREPSGRRKPTPLFQFHKGTIRTNLPIYCNATSCDFNSIKVRLEQVVFCLLWF